MYCCGRLLRVAGLYVHDSGVLLYGCVGLVILQCLLFGFVLLGFGYGGRCAFVIYLTMLAVVYLRMMAGL